MTRGHHGPISTYEWSREHDQRLLNLYRAGVRIEDIEKEFKPRRGRSTLYRRLKLLEEPPREPRKRSKVGRYVAIVVYQEAHPLVHHLLTQARIERCNMKILAEHTGVARETINTWNRGGDPLLSNLEAAGKYLGLRLVWKEIE